MTKITGLSLTLHPVYSSNPTDDFLTALGTLVNWFQGTIVDKIQGYIEGKHTDVYTINPITLSPDDISLTLTPSNVAITANGDDKLLVTADLTPSTSS